MTSAWRTRNFSVDDSWPRGLCRRCSLTKRAAAFRRVAFKPNGTVVILGLTKRSSQRAANLGSRSYAANTLITAAVVGSASKCYRASRFERWVQSGSTGVWQRVAKRTQPPLREPASVPMVGESNLQVYAECHVERRNCC